MQKLIWQNAEGEEINLTSGNYGITEWEGFSNADLNIQSQQVPFQDGGVFLDALLEQRELSVTLAMNDEGNLETRYRLRRELIHALNPKLGEGYLIYTNDFISKRIKCVAQVPLFETHNSNDSGTPKASLAWTACNPYWEDVEETVILLNGSIQEIQNDGDVSIGIKADFVTNQLMFSLINSTQEKGIFAAVDENGKYQVDTNKGEKKFIKKYLGYDMLSGDCLSAIYESNKLFLCMNGGFCTETKDYKTMSVKPINTSARYGFNSICKKDGKYYASGDYYGVFVSTNLLEWKESYSSSASSIWMDLLENNVLITYYGLAKYSTDGENWIDYTKPEGESVRSIIYVSSKEKYYALTQKGIYEGNDLNVWTLKYFDDYSSLFNNIVFDSENDKFIVTVGIDGVYYIKTTSDFSTFTTVYTSTIYLNKIFKINEMFICSDNNGCIIIGNGVDDWNIISSIDGKSALRYTWNEQPYIYLLFANSTIARSIDAQYWEYVNYNENPNFRYNVNNAYLLENDEIYGNGQWYSQYIFFIINKENEITCLSRNHSNSGMVYYEGKYILFDGTDIKQSENGVDFVTITNISLQDNEYLRFILIINDTLVLYGSSIQETFAFTSSDVINWTRIDNVSPILKRPVFFNGKWYSITSTNLCTSIDGFDFTPIRQLESQLPSAMNVSEGKLLFTTGSGTTTHLYIVSSEEEIEVRELDFQKGDFNDGSVICKDGIYYIAAGYNGVVESYSDTYIKNNDIIKNYMSCICQNKNNDVFVFGQAFIGKLDKDLTENVIGFLTRDSNMTLGLEVGKNKFQSNIDGQIEIKYRQKYIGV